MMFEFIRRVFSPSVESRPLGTGAINLMEPRYLKIFHDALGLEIELCRDDGFSIWVSGHCVHHISEKWIIEHFLADDFAAMDADAKTAAAKVRAWLETGER